MASPTTTINNHEGDAFPAVAALARAALAPKDADMVIYHRDCRDGLAAAWAVQHLHNSCRTESTEEGTKLSSGAIHVTYVPMEHNGEVPDVSGRNVLVLDFSFPLETHRMLVKQARTFVVLDHHKSAMENLRGEPNCFFDMAYSGARLAWHYAFGEQPAPRFIRLIEDRDIWRFAFGDASRAYHLALAQLRPTFCTFTSHLDESTLDRAIELGGGALHLMNEQIRTCVKTVDRMKLFCGSLRVGVVSTPLLVSEVGNAIASSAEFDMALIYTQSYERDRLRVALRSDSDEIDVSRIAAVYGGGGHVRAAGFTIDHGDIDKLLLNMMNRSNPLV